MLFQRRFVWGCDSLGWGYFSPISIWVALDGGGEASSRWHQGLVQKVVSLNTIAIRSREIALVIGALMHVRSNVFNCFWRYLCGEPFQLAVWNVISKSITSGMLLDPIDFCKLESLVKLCSETIQMIVLFRTSYFANTLQLPFYLPLHAPFSNFIADHQPTSLTSLTPCCLSETRPQSKNVSSSLLVLCSESPCSSPYLLQSLANARWSNHLVWMVDSR